MFAMFKQMFTAFSMLFSAAEKGAMALDHVASVGEKTARAWSEKTDLTIQAELAAIKAEQAKLLPAPTNS